MGKVAMQTCSFISCEVSTENCKWLPLPLLKQSLTVIGFLLGGGGGGLFFVLEGTAAPLQVRGGVAVPYAVRCSVSNHTVFQLL
jgi:hypothetical protein